MPNARRFRFNLDRYVKARRKLRLPPRSRCIRCGRTTPVGAFMCVSCIKRAKRRIF